MSILQKINLFQSIFERNPLPKTLANATVMGLPLKALEYRDSLKGKGEKYVLSLRLVPDYLALNNNQKNKILKVVPQYNWGYSIDLRGFSSIDDYLESQFRSKPRSIVRRYVRRLETCFPIRYALYHGEMDQMTYQRIFAALHTMIRARFGQKNETHKELWRWNELQDRTYYQILKRQASLFVIYDGEKPIEISLNYHVGPVLFSSISSHDMAYAKFGLGHVEIYKQLEWCLNNGYSLFEMGVGGMDYKRKWSNHIYRFAHWIIFPKETLITRCIGQTEYFKIRLKEYLKSKKLNELRDGFFKVSTTQKEDLISSDTYVFEALEKRPKISLIVCDSVEPFPFGLIKAENDLLYQLEISKKNVSVYRTEPTSNRFYLKANATWFCLRTNS